MVTCLIWEILFDLRNQEAIFFSSMPKCWVNKLAGMQATGGAAKTNVFIHMERTKFSFGLNMHGLHRWNMESTWTAVTWGTDSRRLNWKINLNWLRCQHSCVNWNLAEWLKTNSNAKEQVIELWRKRAERGALAGCHSNQFDVCSYSTSSLMISKWAEQHVNDSQMMLPCKVWHQRTR